MLLRLVRAWTRFQIESRKRWWLYVVVAVVSLVFQARLVDVADWLVGQVNATGLLADILRGLVVPLGLIAFVIVAIAVHAYWDTRPRAHKPAKPSPPVSQGPARNSMPASSTPRWWREMTPEQQIPWRVGLCKKREALIAEGRRLDDESVKPGAAVQIRSAVRAWLGDVEQYAMGDWKRTRTQFRTDLGKITIERSTFEFRGQIRQYLAWLAEHGAFCDDDQSRSSAISSHVQT
jgi:hypothetical protein